MGPMFFSLRERNWSARAAQKVRTASMREITNLRSCRRRERRRERREWRYLVIHRTKSSVDMVVQAEMADALMDEEEGHAASVKSVSQGKLVFTFGGMVGLE